MKIEVAFTEDPQRVSSTAGRFLASQPVLHNMILTLLHARVKRREAGRYWVATDEDEAVGVVLQSPLTLAAHLTPMEPRVASALVDAIADMGVSLPGVNGDAATAASFAGHWTERTRSAATPFQGYRLYELLEMEEDAPAIGGRLRQAGLEDRRLMDPSLSGRNR